MRAKCRKVLLFLDHAGPHMKDTYSNVKLLFLPPNCTSVLQPLDQGIIQNIKANYRKRLLRTVLHKMEETSSLKELIHSVTVLDACHWVHASMNEVKASTVSKCFAKCDICQVPDDNDSDDEDNVPLADLVQLAGRHLSSPITSVQDYIDIDADNAVHEDLGENWEQQLLDDLSASTTRQKDIPSDDDEDDDHDISDSCQITDYCTAARWAKQLHMFCTQHDIPDINMSSLEDHLQKEAMKTKYKSAKQSSIKSFFTKA